MRQSSGGCVRGGKKPTARSIKQDFETFFESFKIRTAWRKDFFDTLNYIMKALEAAEKNPLNRCFFAWRKDTVQFDLFYFHGSFHSKTYHALLGIFHMARGNLLLRYPINHCTRRCKSYEEQQSDQYPRGS